MLIAYNTIPRGRYSCHSDIYCSERNVLCIPILSSDSFTVTGCSVRKARDSAVLNNFSALPKNKKARRNGISGAVMQAKRQVHLPEPNKKNVETDTHAGHLQKAEFVELPSSAKPWLGSCSVLASTLDPWLTL